MTSAFSFLYETFLFFLFFFNSLVVYNISLKDDGVLLGPWLCWSFVSLCIATYFLTKANKKYNSDFDSFFYKKGGEP